MFFYKGSDLGDVFTFPLVVGFHQHLIHAACKGFWSLLEMTEEFGWVANSTLSLEKNFKQEWVGGGTEGREPSPRKRGSIYCPVKRGLI